MKKFMAIVMCLAMALSMMTVVSFAAVDSVNLVMGPVCEYTVDDGMLDELDTIDVDTMIAVPVTVSDRNGLKGGSFKVEWDPTLLSMSTDYNEDDNIYAGFPEIASTGLFNQMCSVNIEEGSITVAGARKSAFSSGKVDFSLGYMVFTVLPGAAGKTVTLSIDPEKSKYNDGTGDKDWTEANNLTFKVAGDPVVTEPTVEETFVDTNPVDGQPAYLCVLQPAGNVTKMGIKCDGYDTFWAYADNEGTFATTTAAVKVIGLEDATFTTVVE